MFQDVTCLPRNAREVEEDMSSVTPDSQGEIDHSYLSAPHHIPEHRRKLVRFSLSVVTHNDLGPSH